MDILFLFFRYVDRLRDSLKQKLVSADKMALTERETAAVRRVAEEEEEALKPQLEVLKKQTKVLKNQVTWVALFGTKFDQICQT